MVKIPNNIIDQIIKQNDIVNIISEYVNIEKKGKNYFGLCPFHHEKTPSFSVSPEKQIFHCFSCGEGGDVVKFISKIENMQFYDSLKLLAEKANINVSQYQVNRQNNENQKYYKVNQFVCDYYQFALMNTTVGTNAIEYLKNRHLSIDTIKQFKIGLAPDSVDSLYQALKSNNFNELTMLELGHVNKINGKIYDKFKKRIMFPITDEYSNIVGFSGRIYEENNKNEPKYINTQETPVFKKSHIIYNLDHAKKFIKQSNRVFLFEGFMDVISSVNAGLNEAVATMGTALTDSHVHKLKKYTNNFVLCYDGDAAGIEATKRTCKLLIKHQVNILVVQFPLNLDPDDYINQYGHKQFMEFVNHKQKSYKEYMYDEYYRDVNMNNLSTIETFKQKVFSLIQDGTHTEIEWFLNKLSQDINVSVKTLEFDFNKQNKVDTNLDLGNQEPYIRQAEKQRPKRKKLIKAHDELFYMFLYDRKHIKKFGNTTSVTIPIKKYRRLYYDLNDYYNLYDKFNRTHFMEKYVDHDEKYKDFFLELYDKYLKEDMSNYTEKQYDQCMTVIRKELIVQYINSLKEQFNNSQDEEQRGVLLQKIINYTKDIKTSNN